MWKSSRSRGRTCATPTATACRFSFDDLTVLSDEDLLSHLDHRHADAVAVLYQRYRRLVFSVALQILGDYGESEDVVQNVFLDIYRTSLRFDPERGTVKMWVLQFAYSRSFRRRQQLVTRKFYSSVDISEVENSLAAEASNNQSIENTCAVGSALENLGGEQKRVVELVSQGHSLRDIAEATGQKLANVRHHYYRGLAKLRMQFRQRGERSRQSEEAADVIT